MVYLIVNWVLSSIGLFALANTLPGFHISDQEAALIAAGVVGLMSGLMGTLLRYAGNVIGLAMSAAFLLTVDVFLVRVSGLLVPGFSMRGFGPAIMGALALLLLNLVLVRAARSKLGRLDSESLLRG